MNHNDDYESGNSYGNIHYSMEGIKSGKSLIPYIDEENNEYNPFSDTTTKGIGNTIYKITVSCQGKEPILDKLRRILFDDPLSAQPQKEVKIE